MRCMEVDVVQRSRYQASVVKTYNNEWNRFPQSWQVGKRVIPVRLDCSRSN